MKHRVYIMSYRQLSASQASNHRPQQICGAEWLHTPSQHYSSYSIRSGRSSVIVCDDFGSLQSSQVLIGYEREVSNISTSINSIHNEKYVTGQRSKMKIYIASDLPFLHLFAMADIQTMLFREVNRPRDQKYLRYHHRHPGETNQIKQP